MILTFRFRITCFRPAHPFLDRCRTEVIRPTARQHFKLLRLMCGFVLGSVHNFITLPTVNGSLDLVLWLHGVCWLYHVLLLYAVATEAAIVIFAFFISHFIHCLLTVIVWIQV